ncbi:hypothetical protein CY0110_15992 [Crocosphaera chwakensis CCY0110]|uniref:Uncharacterized protein n=1 Tax=Crocosphaera chwakensis CCY0110 TaxID=391612 RepID=A3IHN0_9CHRO|nr:hypothetical protein CY0110_15992 [Crocosphaera chwakensis CCY0110]
MQFASAWWTTGSAFPRNRLT